MRRFAFRLLMFGGPFPFFLWPTIRETPTVGVSLSIATAILASLIVSMAENSTWWQYRNVSD
jgi:hypothetical protein